MTILRRHGRMLTAILLSLVLICICIHGRSATVAWGSQGDTVRRVQERLRQYGYYSGAVDGVFGQKTYDAVIWFQKNNSLRQDGVVGRATAAALGISLNETAAASASTESEIYTLARLVHGEARGEPYIGKVAVAAVVAMGSGKDSAGGSVCC